VSDLTFNCANTVTSVEVSMQSARSCLCTSRAAQGDSDISANLGLGRGAGEKGSNLGFLHQGVGSAHSIEPGPMCALIARIFSRKITKDLTLGHSGKKRNNIMKVTKVQLQPLETNSLFRDDTKLPKQTAAFSRQNFEIIFDSENATIIKNRPVKLDSRF
jgi:hypothetical protein